MTKTGRVQPHIADSVLRDPFEPMTYIPNELIHETGLSLEARGLLAELLVVGDGWDIDAARAAELKRRAGGCLPEDVDALLGELEAAGYITVDE